MLLRNEKAKLWGFKNMQSMPYKKETQRVKTIINFLWELVELSKDKAVDEMKEIETFC